jgi:hypothetical protein
MRMRCALVFLLVVLPVAAAAAGIPSQSLDVRYDPEQRTIAGTLEIRLPDAPETAYFLLIPNLGREANPHVSKRVLDESYPYGFDEAWLDILSVELGQSPSLTRAPHRLLDLPPTLQTYSLEGTVLAVDLADAGEDPALRITFETKAPRTSAGDDGITEGILTWRFGWYPLYIEDSALLVEEDQVVRHTESSSFPIVLPWTDLKAAVTAPADLVFFSGADDVRTTELPEAEEDENLSRHEAVFTTPTRSFAIAFGADYERYVLDGPTAIEVAYRPGHEDTARLYATYARDILAAYGPKYGEYPRERLTIVESPNRQGTAFAADGILWLPSLAFTHRDTLLPGILNRFVEFVLAHEIAHEWFGIGTSVDLDTDGWLSEGLAQYASISYFEERFGGDGGNLFKIFGEGIFEDLVDRQFGFYNLREHQVELPYLFNLWSGFDEAIVKPTNEVEYANADVVRLYDKGYLAARTIASAVGEETFDEALRASCAAGRAERLTAEAFEAFVAEATGRSVEALFDAWVFGDATVDYSVEITEKRQVPPGYETIVAVAREGGIPQPVEVEATLTSGATVREIWDGAESEGTVVFETPSAVSRVTIDPDHRIPDGNRLNNNDPVKIVTAVNRNALPLDAYVLVPDAASGGFSFGWLDRFRVTIEDTTASMVVNEGREHQVSGAVTVAEDQLTGNLTYTRTAYDRIDVGSPAGYWEADIALSAGIHRIASANGPFWALRFAALDLPSIAHSSTTSIVLDFAAGGAARLGVAAFDEIRLLPNFYIQGTGALGISVGPLPSPLRFTFDELHASSLVPAPNKLSGRLDLELTTIGEPFNVVNVAIAERSRTRLFVAGGLGWTSLEDYGTTIPGVEVGIEQIVELSTLGGLVPFSVRLGVATPVVGVGEPVFYVGVSF